MGEFEQALRDIFGDSIDRLNKFQSDQLKKVTDRMREMARESVRDELGRLEKEISDLRTRIAALESSRPRGTGES